MVSSSMLRLGCFLLLCFFIAGPAFAEPETFHHNSDDSVFSEESSNCSNGNPTFFQQIRVQPVSSDVSVLNELSSVPRLLGPGSASLDYSNSEARDHITIDIERIVRDHITIDIERIVRSHLLNSPYQINVLPDLGENNLWVFWYLLNYACVFASTLPKKKKRISIATDSSKLLCGEEGENQPSTSSQTSFNVGPSNTICSPEVIRRRINGKWKLDEIHSDSGEEGENQSSTSSQTAFFVSREATRKRKNGKQKVHELHSDSDGDGEMLPRNSFKVRRLTPYCPRWWPDKKNGKQKVDQICSANSGEKGENQSSTSSQTAFFVSREATRKRKNGKQMVHEIHSDSDGDGEMLSQTSFKVRRLTPYCRRWWLDKKNGKQKVDQICSANSEKMTQHKKDFLRCNSGELELHSATDYYEEGITFRKRELGRGTNKSILDISFSYGILRIPKLSVGNNTIKKLRKHIASEQTKHNKKVTNYLQFLASLVREPKDVHLLSKRGIINSNHYSAKKVVEMIQNLYEETMQQTSGESYLKPMYQDLNKRYHNKFWKWSVLLGRKLTNPCFLISMTIASIPIVGVIFAVLKYYKSTSSGSGA